MKKEASKKRIAAWDEADYANKLKPFYGTSYDMNQITWIHNKRNITTCICTKGCICQWTLHAIERERARFHRNVLSKASWNTGKDGIYYRFHIL